MNQIDHENPTSAEELFQTIKSNDLTILGQLLGKRKAIVTSILGEPLVATIELGNYGMFDLLAQEFVRDQMAHDNYRGCVSASHVAIARAVLGSLDPYYWQTLYPYLVVILDEMAKSEGILPKPSLPVIRFIHKHGQITRLWWLDLFKQAIIDENIEQDIRDLWQIRITGSSSPVADRDLVGEVIIVCATADLPTENRRSQRRILAIETLLRLYPEAIADHQERLARAILVGPLGQPLVRPLGQPLVRPPPPNSQSWSPSRLSDWLSETDLIDHSVFLPLVSEIKSTTEQMNRLLTELTINEDVQYLHADHGTTLVNWAPIENSVVEGWTTFQFCSRYFYSRRIYLDLPRSRLVRADTRCPSYIAPDYLSRLPLEMPATETLIQIAHGRYYDQVITIPAPAFLLDWYHARTNAKSARSAIGG